jgi:hypothetical protein
MDWDWPSYIYIAEYFIQLRLSLITFKINMVSRDISDGHDSEHLSSGYCGWVPQHLHEIDIATDSFQVTRDRWLILMIWTSFSWPHLYAVVMEICWIFFRPASLRVDRKYENFNIRAWSGISGVLGSEDGSRLAPLSCYMLSDVLGDLKCHFWIWRPLPGLVAWSDHLLKKGGVWDIVRDAFELLEDPCSISDPYADGNGPVFGPMSDSKMIGWIRKRTVFGWTFRHSTQTEGICWWLSPIWYTRLCDPYAVWQDRNRYRYFCKPLTLTSSFPASLMVGKCGLCRRSAWNMANGNVIRTPFILWRFLGT